MNEKLSLASHKFSSALARLDEALAAPPSPLQPDAVLQRFEFTFELCWKTLRIFLKENEGIDVSSPKGALRAAFRQGLIETAEEPDFLGMLEDRNTSSHVYDEQEAVEIFVRVRDRHAQTLHRMLSRIQIEQ